MNIINRLVCKSVLRGIKNDLTHLKVLNGYAKSLYSPAAMAIENYVSVRERTLSQFASGVDKFKSKMAEFSDENSQHMIFTEDLKSMIHLAEDNEDDLKIVHAMMRKFNLQNRELRFGSFIFGPVVMRLFYHLNRPLEALAAFKDETLAGMFDQLISYQILMDLLYNNGLYDEVIEVFQIVVDKQLQPHRYPKNVVVLFYAACYKKNTPESFAKASETWKDLKAVGHIPMRKATTFAAGLALNQGAPHVALEILSNEYQQNYITVRNIKVCALSQLGRPDDVVPVLRGVLNTDGERKHTFTEDTMDTIRKAFERCSDKELVAEYERIIKQFEVHGLVVPQTLDSFLCQDIIGGVFNPRDGSKRLDILAGSYNRRGPAGTGGGTRYRQRPGLADMV